MIKYTLGRPKDCVDIAKLHAQSWKHHYRGIMADKYLDEEVDDERLKIWTERFETYNPNQMVILATSNGQLCGFSCHFLDYDPVHGNYLDNLHVLPDFQGLGIGRTLMQLSISHCMQFDHKPFFLYVFAQNLEAIKFYNILGGRSVTETIVEAPGQCSGYSTLLYRWDQPEKVLQLS